MLEIETVAILGAGRDAVRTALLCALAGLEVRLADERPDALDAAFRELRHDVEQALAAGLVDRADRQRIFDGILITSDLDEAVTGADLAFAAEPEPAAARALLLRISGACRATSVLATAVDPAAVAGLPQPGRVVGLAVEDGDGLLPRLAVRAGPATTEHARARAERLAEEIARAAGGRR